MTVAVFDHPYLSGLLGDAETASAFSAGSDLAAMLRFESALAAAESETGVIPGDAAERIASVCAAFRPDVEALRAGTARDGVVVPELVRQLRAAVGRPHDGYVHYGATSQDAIDTSLVLRLQPVLGLFGDRLRGLVAQLDALTESFGTAPLTGKTRLQSALPMTVSDRLRNWAEPLAGHAERLAALRPSLSRVQFGGAVGTLDALGDKGPAVRAALAARLALADPHGTWHTQRIPLGEFGSWLSEVCATLGKMGTDICLMAQDEVRTAQLAGGGSSSAMPHKRNPIAAEALVTLARYNAAQLGGLHQALLHEQERSGAMWTLEWMILPGMVVATGAALGTAHRLAGAIAALGDA